MALTDWVFPEMGYTRKQDKRALYENMIAPVYSGVTDNRSRVAEGIQQAAICLCASTTYLSAHCI